MILLTLNDSGQDRRWSAPSTSAAEIITFKDRWQQLLAEEREAWRKMWAEVAELLKKAGNAK